MGRLEEVVGTHILVTNRGSEIRLGHTYHEVKTIQKILRLEEPKTFIEVGVHEGGLSYILIPEFSKSLSYYGIELHCDLIQPDVRFVYNECCATLICNDCFDFPLLNNLSFLFNKVIYCDGGNKAKELEVYKKLCVSGDLIFAHDFHDGKRKVTELRKSQIHPEVTLDMVKHLDEDSTFMRYREDLLCKTRIIGWRKL